LTVTPLTLKGQTFSVSTDTSINAGSISSSFIITDDINVTNLSANTLNLNWVRILDSLPANWTSSIFSSWGDYPPFASQGQFIIPPGSSGNIRIAFNTNYTAGTGTVRLLLYDGSDSTNSNQTITYILKVCGPNESDSIIVPPSMYQYCLGDSLQLNAENGYTNYTWSNGDSTQATYHALTDTIISILAVDNFGCNIADTLNLNIQFPFDESICIVTVDGTTGKNIIVWGKTSNVGTVQTNIYKETQQAGVYNLIGSVPFDSLSIFIDVNSNPLQSAARYKISVIDTCGNESDMSAEHKTIHVTASVGTGGESNLAWSAYGGFTFSTYQIWRGSSSTNMTLIDSVQSNLFTYTDQNPPSGLLYYQIEVLKNNSCIPTKSSYMSTRSNIAENGLTEVNNMSFVDKIDIYPNPSNGSFFLIIPNALKLNDTQINITNALGQEMLTMRAVANKVDINLSGQPEGIYFLTITNETTILNKKIVIRK